MNIVRLMGGIGNQFFQYAFGKVFQEKGIEVAYDLSWFGQYNGDGKSVKFPRVYRMDKFRVNIDTDPMRQRTNFVKNRDSIIENNKIWDERIFTLDHTLFEGYWQRMRHYKEIYPKLCDELLLKDEVKTPKFLRLADEIKNSESIAVHVRRGDYLGLWPFLEMSYYTDQIKKLNGDLYIFSDDIQWCRSAFMNTGRKTTFIDMDDYLAFELMRLCRHKITANSTFSWWAAWLGGNTGTIFCPKYWLGFRVAEDEQRYPEEWIRIS
jgi:hypothetical protein